MKNWMIVFSCLLLFLLISCSKDEKTELDGKWQLQEIAQNGEVQYTDTIYYNFQNTLFMYQTYSPTEDIYRKSYGFKVQEGNQLALELVSDPQPVKDFLLLTDWTSAKRTFTIDKHDCTKLILQSEGRTYTFRKF